MPCRLPLPPGNVSSRNRFWHVLYIDDVEEKHSERILQSAVSDFTVPIVFTVVSNCFLALERIEMTEYDLIMVKTTLDHFQPEEFIRVLQNTGIPSKIILMVPDNMKTPKSLRHSEAISSIIKTPFSFQTLRLALVGVFPSNYVHPISPTATATVQSERSSAISTAPSSDVTTNPASVQVNYVYSGQSGSHLPAMTISNALPSPPDHLLQAALLQQQQQLHYLHSHPHTRPYQSSPVINTRKQQLAALAIPPIATSTSISTSLYSEDAERTLLAITRDFCTEDLSMYTSDIIAQSSCFTSSSGSTVSSPRILSSYEEIHASSDASSSDSLASSYSSSTAATAKAYHDHSTMKQYSADHVLYHHQHHSMRNTLPAHTEFHKNHDQVHPSMGHHDDDRDDDHDHDHDHDQQLCAVMDEDDIAFIASFPWEEHMMMTEE